MLQSIGSNVFLVMTVMVFIAMLLLLEGGYLLWKSYRGPKAKKIEGRLRTISAALESTRQTQILRQNLLREVPRLHRYFLGVLRAQQLERYIVQAGLAWSVSRLLLSSLGLGALGALLMVYGARQPLALSVLVAGCFALLPLAYVARKRNARVAHFERQLPDALDLITRALRSGHSFSSALKMAGEEMPEPIGGELRIVHDEVNFGVTQQQALTNLSTRVPLTDLRYFVISVLIQRESGGNLTEVLGNLSRLIRERLKLMAKVKVLSSEGRLSAWVLGVMPFALAGVMMLVNPAFMTPLWTDPIGIGIIKYMLILMAIGVVIMRSIIKIRV